MRTVTREQPNSRQGFFRPLIRVIFSVGTLLVLAACGGGGGGGDDPPAPPANPPANPAPEANAGADQTITLPTNSVQLQGSATDSGPAATLTYSWSVTTGSNVTLSAASSAATTATFAAEGTYVLTLTVSDGNSNDTDTVQVVVNPAPAGNAAPVVQAGVDQTAELPFGEVELAGSATDDGLPASSTLTYQWSTTGTGVNFADPAAAATMATFSAAGTYDLILTVGDGALSATDTVQVIVNPAVYPAASTDADPNQGWTVATPAEVGMDEAGLIAARDYALTGGGSGMIIRRGRLVYQWGNINFRYELKSTTKSIGGIALGLAIDDGLVALTDVAQVHLPSIGNPPANRPDWLDDITVLQLATHTAGFQKRGDYRNQDFQPGTTWFYSDGGLNWLADLLTEVFDQDLNTLLATEVWSVVGIVPGIDGTDLTLGDDLRWRPNVFRPGPHPSGIEHRELASGIYANTNAMARIGLLFLRNGVWANDARVLSESFVDTVQTPQSVIASALNPDAANFPEATTNYGVLWWTNATGMMPDVPRDAYWAWGLGDSLIVVIPSLDLVIVRAGPVLNANNTPDDRVWNDFDWNGDYSVLIPFLTPIVESVTP